MNKLLMAGTVCLGLASCTPKQELSQDEALQLLRQEMNYPKVYDYDVFCADPESAQKLLEAGLEKDGLVTVKRTQKMTEIGQPLIEFTSKATSYLLTSSEEDKRINIQKVKLADEDLAQVTGIKTDDQGKKATVEYTTTYINITPFAALLRTDLKKQMPRTAHFTLYDNGWRMEKKNE